MPASASWRRRRAAEPGGHRRPPHTPAKPADGAGGAGWALQQRVRAVGEGGSLVAPTHSVSGTDLQGQRGGGAACCSALRTWPGAEHLHELRLDLLRRLEPAQGRGMEGARLREECAIPECVGASAAPLAQSLCCYMHAWKQASCCPALPPPSVPKAQVQDVESKGQRRDSRHVRDNGKCYDETH